MYAAGRGSDFRASVPGTPKLLSFFQILSDLEGCAQVKNRAEPSGNLNRPSLVRARLNSRMLQAWATLSYEPARAAVGPGRLPFERHSEVGLPSIRPAALVLRPIWPDYLNINGMRTGFWMLFQ